MEEIKMTKEQQERLNILRKRWKKILSVESGIGSDDHIMVHVQGESGATMWLGIEADGYCHS
jgi:hypothetical protein